MDERRKKEGVRERGERERVRESMREKEISGTRCKRVCQLIMKCN